MLLNDNNVNEVENWNELTQQWVCGYNAGCSKPNIRSLTGFGWSNVKRHCHVLKAREMS